VSGLYPFLTYWYFHLPNFVLAALMYTLLGRASRDRPLPLTHDRWRYRL
jgi:hypothetical protein